MVKKAGASKPGVAEKGRVPDFNGVPGELVDAALIPDGVMWGGRTRKSPYDPLLQQLAEAGPGKILKFGDLKARVSITVRAKKLGLKVTCGEDRNVLYVRFDGRVEDDVRGSRREKLRSALKSAPSTAFKLTQTLVAKGDTTVDANTVLAILTQMVRSGEVIAQEGGTYALNARHKEA